MRVRISRWVAPAAMALCLVGFVPLAASAQSNDDEMYEDLYENEGDYDDDNMSFALGAGLVDPDGDGEIYFSANFRFRIGGRHDGYRDDDDDDDYRTEAEEYNRRHNRRHYRGGSREGEGIRGYLEPEIGYWEQSEQGVSVEDLLIGINLVGVVPTRNADFFAGVGFGLHFYDSSVSSAVGSLDESDERLGGNVQVGVEVYLSNKVGLFGVGRLDILEDAPNDRQTKIWGGLRFHF